MNEDLMLFFSRNNLTKSNFIKYNSIKKNKGSGIYNKS